MENKFKNRYTAIACINNKGAIAKDRKLLYRIKADLENFKSLTVGNVVIMGRLTFESLGCRPLKDRVNIILTTKNGFKLDNVEGEEFKDTYICNSLKELDDLCYAYFSDKELFIIGGSSIYFQAFYLGIVDKAIITLVNDDQDGDIFFPQLENDDRYKVIFKTMSIRDHIHDKYYRYIVYKKKE